MEKTKVLTPSEEFLKGVEGVFFKHIYTPPTHTRKSVEDTLGTYFAEKNSVQKKVNSFILDVLAGSAQTQISKLGTGYALGMDLIKYEMHILHQYSTCFDDDGILAQVLGNDNLTVKYLNYLRLRGNVIIAKEAGRIMDEIFKQMKEFILKEKVTSDNWGSLLIEDLSMALLPKIIHRFKNRCTDGALRPEQLLKSREEVKSIAEQVREIAAKKTSPPVNTNVNTKKKVHVSALQMFVKNSFNKKNQAA